MEHGSFLCNIKLSPPTKWLSMAPRAMIDAKLPSAMKKVHKPAKSKAMQKNKAKVHKVHKKPAQAQALDSCPEMDDVIQEDQEEEPQEEQQEEQEGECQEDEAEAARKDTPQTIKRSIAAFGRNCPRRPRLCKKQCRRSRTSPTGLASRSNWPTWPKPTLAKSGTTNFSRPFNHCTRRGPKQGKTL